MADAKCPFDEEDCLLARSLLFEAVKLLDEMTQAAIFPSNRVDGNLITPPLKFLKRPEIAPLVELARTGQIPFSMWPANGQFRRR